jgi:hypothetical protein
MAKEKPEKCEENMPVCGTLKKMLLKMFDLKAQGS